VLTFLPCSSYSLWLSGSDSPSSGYANITNRFHLEGSNDHGGRPISAGTIAGLVAGILACLTMFAAVTAILLRLQRQKTSNVRENVEEEEGQYEPSKSILHEKAPGASVMRTVCTFQS
jgi:hypothetical protein